MTQQQQRAQHLFCRAGFGASPTEIQQAALQPIGVLVRQLLKNSKKTDDIAIVQAEPQAELKMIKKRSATKP